MEIVYGEKQNHCRSRAKCADSSLYIYEHAAANMSCDIENKSITGNDSIPVGTVISYMGMTVPDYYLVFDGTATFSVPDLRGECSD